MNGGKDDLGAILNSGSLVEKKTLEETTDWQFLGHPSRLKQLQEKRASISLTVETTLRVVVERCCCRDAGRTHRRHSEVSRGTPLLQKRNTRPEDSGNAARSNAGESFVLGALQLGDSDT